MFGLSLDRRTWAAGLAAGLAFIVILVTAARVDAAAQSVTLYAGQNTAAGTVSTEVIGTDLVVTYQAAAGWQFTETHFWVGDDLTTLPKNKAGNPTLGHFPYLSGALSGASTWSVTIPLATLDASCGDTLLAAAHAAMQQVDGSGNVLRTETGWGAGTRLVAKGSWATYFSFTVECPPPPPPVTPDTTCETAWALGQQTFDELDIATRWGWVLEVDGFAEVPIYAAAGNNVIANGTLVGNLTVVASGSSVTVTYEMLPGFTMGVAQLYVGNTLPTTAAPGQLGNIHDLTDASSDTFTVAYSGTHVFIAAHADVCGANW